jgi:hypothetical protein
MTQAAPAITARPPPIDSNIAGRLRLEIQAVHRAGFEGAGFVSFIRRLPLILEPITAALQE